MYGRYDLLLPEDPQLYVYTRTLDDQKLLVVCNLTGSSAALALPQTFAAGTLLISNYEDTTPCPAMQLRPWEAFAMLQED